MYFDESMIVRRVPKWIINRTRVNMDKYCMGLYDAFKEAVTNYPQLSRSELYWPWFFDDYRLYIPSAYHPEYMDFTKYPLKYKA